MSTLYRRATPTQVRILRIVEGAVKNAQDAHSDIQISPSGRRSIAKRAAGTLSACWPELAASGPSSSERADLVSPTRRLSHLEKATVREAAQALSRFPLRRLIQMIAKDIGPLKRAGNNERAQAFIDVLKMIHQIKTGGSLPTQPERGEG